MPDIKALLSLGAPHIDGLRTNRVLDRERQPDDHLSQPLSSSRSQLAAPRVPEASAAHKAGARECGGLAEPSMKLLIVDDHPALRQGIAAILKQADQDAMVLQASCVDEAIAAINTHEDIDIVVLDLFMPTKTGWDALQLIGQTRQDVPVIVMSSSEHPGDVQRALSLGALGYVPKSASHQVLLSAVRLVMNGDVYVPPLVLHEVFPREAASQPKAGEGALTFRQIDVLRLLADGLPNKIIAHRLNLSEKTVKTHITSIFRALRVVNRTQAAKVARRERIL